MTAELHSIALLIACTIEGMLLYLSVSYQSHGRVGHLIHAFTGLDNLIISGTVRKVSTTCAGGSLSGSTPVATLAVHLSGKLGIMGLTCFPKPTFNCILLL